MNPFHENTKNDQNGSLNKGLTFPYSLANNYPTNSVTRSALVKLMKSQKFNYQFCKQEPKIVKKEDFWIKGVDVGVPICSMN